MTRETRERRNTQPHGRLFNYIHLQTLSDTHPNTKTPHTSREAQRVAWTQRVCEQASESFSTLPHTHDEPMCDEPM